MSRTHKDSRRNARKELRVARREDGLFDVSYLDEMLETGITERSLAELVCIRFGFCGDEFDQILRALNEKGSWTRAF